MSHKKCLKFEFEIENLNTQYKNIILPRLIVKFQKLIKFSRYRLSFTLDVVHRKTKSEIITTNYHSSLKRLFSEPKRRRITGQISDKRNDCTLCIVELIRYGKWGNQTFWKTTKGFYGGQTSKGAFVLLTRMFDKDFSTNYWVLHDNLSLYS